MKLNALALTTLLLTEDSGWQARAIQLRQALHQRHKASLHSKVHLKQGKKDVDEKTEFSTSDILNALSEEEDGDYSQGSILEQQA